MVEIVAPLRRELSAIRDDITQLTAQISELQAQLQLAEQRAGSIKTVLALYPTDEAPMEPTIPRAPDTPFTPAGTDAQAPKPEREDIRPTQRVSKQEQMRNEVANLLRLRGTVHRNRILEDLTAKGIMGSEKSPLAHLAAFLSDNRDRFASDGRGNFSLRDPQTDPPPRPRPRPRPQINDSSQEEAGGVTPPAPA